MGINKSREKLNKKMMAIRQGDFYSINNQRVKGHKGKVTKKNKNGNIEAVILTHAVITRRHKNIPLEENPEEGHTEQSYIVRQKEIVRPEHVGKHHKNLQVKNKSDKSKIRHVAK